MPRSPLVRLTTFAKGYGGPPKLQRRWKPDTTGNAYVALRTRPRRPDDALIFFRHHRQSLVGELLHPLTAIGLGGVDVPFRVGRDAVHAVELARLTPAF